MTTRASKLCVTCPLSHFYLSYRHPIRSSLLDERFHESKKNRHKNKPDKKYKYLKPTMREQIKCHNIASTYNGIEQIRDNIHDDHEATRSQERILLPLRYNVEIYFIEIPVVPGIYYKCCDCCCCCYEKYQYFILISHFIL